MSTGTELSTLLTNYLHNDVSLSAADKLLYLNLGQKRIIRDAPTTLRKKSASLSVTNALGREYSLPSDFYQMSGMWIRTVGVKLSPMAPSEWIEVIERQPYAETQTGYPRMYHILGYDESQAVPAWRIKFDRTPDVNYTIYYWYYYYPTAITAGATPTLSSIGYDELLLWASAMVALQPKDPQGHAIAKQNYLENLEEFRAYMPMRPDHAPRLSDDYDDRRVKTVQVISGYDLSNSLADTSNTELGDAMVGYKDTRATTSVVRTVHSRLGDVHTSITNFGAVGDNSTDDTAAIKAAIAAITATGGIVHVPMPSVKWKFTDTITIPSGVVLEGDGGHGTLVGATTLTRGSVFSYLGSASKTLFSMSGASFAGLRKIGIEGNQVASCVAVLISSTNNPISRKCSCEELAIMNMGDGLTTGVGIQVGEGGSYQCDQVFLNKIYAGLCYQGLLINSDNSMDFGTIQNIYTYACNRHIDIERGTDFTIKNAQFAKYMGSTPCAVRINSGGNVTLENLICEADEALGATEGYGLWIVSGDYKLPISLIKCKIANVKVDYTTLIYSRACNFSRATNALPIVELVGTDVIWESHLDGFTDYSTDPDTYPEWSAALSLNPGTNYTIMEYGKNGIKQYGYPRALDFTTNGGTAAHPINVDGTARGSVNAQKIVWGTGITNPYVEVNDGTTIARLQVDSTGHKVYLGGASDHDVYFISGATGAERWKIDKATGELWDVEGGNIKLPSLPTYANNTAAVGGGLVAGQTYRTGADPDVICVVH